MKYASTWEVLIGNQERQDNTSQTVLDVQSGSHGHRAQVFQCVVFGTSSLPTPARFDKLHDLLIRRIEVTR